jgi:hypothetical protein
VGYTRERAVALADDGFSIGVLYRGERAVAAPPLQPQILVTDIEKEFALGG